MRSADPRVQALRDRPGKPKPPPMRRVIKGGWSYKEIEMPIDDSRYPPPTPPRSYNDITRDQVAKTVPITEEQRLENECYRAKQLVIAEVKTTLKALSPDTTLPIKLHRALENLRDAMSALEYAETELQLHKMGRKA